jgi:hypothetical protein
MKVFASTVAIAVTFASMPLASADDLSWKRGVPGARAFLEMDGSGGSDEAVLCNTLKEYVEWREETPLPDLQDKKAPVTGCHEFPRGLPARLDGIFPDPSGDPGFPIARVTIESRRYSGYMGLSGLKPVVPPGTVVHYSGKGLGQTSLAPSSTFGGECIHIDGAVTVRVLRYLPTAELYELNVQVLTGKMVGRTGWMQPGMGETSDGNPVDWFNETAAAAANYR